MEEDALSIFTVTTIKSVEGEINLHCSNSTVLETYNFANSSLETEGQKVY